MITGRNIFQNNTISLKKQKLHQNFSKFKKKYIKNVYLLRISQIQETGCMLMGSNKTILSKMPELTKN